VLIAVIAVVSFSTGHICGATLVGSWDFNEGEGTVAGDKIFWNDGTIHNATWVEGICGYALAFDGESSYVQVPDAGQYNMTQAVSVEAWVLMTPWQSCTQPNVFDKSHRGPDQPPYYSGYTIQGALVETYALAFVACNGNGCPELHSEAPLNDSVWHFVVGTASTQDSVIRFYLDGEMTMELPFKGPINTNEGDIFIGRHYLLGRYFSGLIDQVKVYEGALTPEEVWLHYNAPCERDVRALSILAPTGIVQPDSVITPTAEVKNVGQSPETFPVVFQIGSIYCDTAYVTTPLEPGATDTVSFAPWTATLTRSVTYATTCSTTLNGDMYTRNDAVHGIVTVSTGLEPVIFSLSPNNGGNTGWLTVQIIGDHFQDGAVVKLTMTEQSDIVGVSTFIDAGHLITTFDLTGKGLGVWNVVVENPDNSSATFVGGFMIEEGFAQLWADIVGREQIRVGRESEYLLLIGNSGNVNVDNIIPQVSVPEGADLISIEVAGQGEPILIGDSLRAYNIEPENIPLWISTLPPGKVEKFKLKIIVPASPLLKHNEVIELPEPGVSITGSVLGALECLAKNILKAYEGDLNLDPEELRHALKEAAITFGTSALTTIVTYAVCTAAGQTITCMAFFEGYSLGQGVVTAAKDIGQLISWLFRLFPVEYVWSWDPNDKAGPCGFNTSDHFVALGEVFQYMVFFENESTATAPAETIVVVDTLDSNLDWSTIFFEETSHPGTVDFDSSNGVITWRFDGINLPPNVNPPEGEGWVSYTIRPNQDLISGTKIENLAWVTFDYQTWACPMDSIPIFNTIDALAPYSQISDLPDTVQGHEFEVCWSGEDDASGSGIRNYTIYYSVNGGPDSVWLANTTDTCATFHAPSQPVPTTRYTFYSIARDNVGNVEPKDTANRTPIFVDIGEEKEEELPFDFSLSQNYPNPFNPSSVIQYAIPRQCHVKITIYNILGQKVRTLVDKEQTIGYKKVIWDSRNDKGEEVASGVYFYKIKADEFTQVKKMVLLK
jgi:uncharacterized repeat protein (TIGR01451 family)